MESMTSQLASGSKSSVRSSRSSEASEGSAGELRWPGVEAVSEAYARFSEERRSERQTLMTQHEHLLSQNNKLQQEKQALDKRLKASCSVTVLPKISDNFYLKLQCFISGFEGATRAPVERPREDAE